MKTNAHSNEWLWVVIICGWERPLHKSRTSPTLKWKQKHKIQKYKGRTYKTTQMRQIDVPLGGNTMKCLTGTWKLRENIFRSKFKIWNVKNATYWISPSFIAAPSAKKVTLSWSLKAFVCQLLPRKGKKHFASSFAFPPTISLHETLWKSRNVMHCLGLWKGFCKSCATLQSCCKLFKKYLLNSSLS